MVFYETIDFVAWLYIQRCKVLNRSAVNWKSFNRNGTIARRSLDWVDQFLETRGRINFPRLIKNVLNVDVTVTQCTVTTRNYTLVDRLVIYYDRWWFVFVFRWKLCMEVHMRQLERIRSSISKLARVLTFVDVYDRYRYDKYRSVDKFIIEIWVIRKKIMKRLV